MARSAVPNQHFCRSIWFSVARTNVVSLQTPHSSSTHHTPLIIGIRREDPLRIWERRAPLTPDDVKYLSIPSSLPFPLEIHIQPSQKRIFSDSAYAEAGAKVTESLSDAHVLIGIKEVGIEEVMCDAVGTPGNMNGKVPRTYLMFSHTAKGQEYNMPLLNRFLENELDAACLSPPTSSSGHSESLLPTLIDYELLTSSSSGKRTLAFGFHAGLAGTLLSLYTLGEYFLREYGIRTPFLWTPLPHLPFPKILVELRRALRDVVGGMIRAMKDGTGKEFGPCVIGVTGSGNVSRGCLSMLAELPHQFVEVNELHDLVHQHTLQGKQVNLDKLFIVHVKPEHYLIHKDSLDPLDLSPSSTTFVPSYSRSNYHASPSSYASVFSSRIAPFLTLLLNGAGWAPGYPRMMTEEGVKETGKLIGRMAEDKREGRFAVVGDISCDPYGGLEFVTHATTLSQPFYRMELPSLSSTSSASDPNTLKHSATTSDSSNMESNLKSELPNHPIYIQSVDILPASLPIDASNHFSNGLREYLWGIVRRYASEVESNVTSNEAGKAEQERKQEELEKEVDDALQRATITSRGRLAGRFAEEGFLGAKVGLYRAKVGGSPGSLKGSKRTMSSLSVSSFPPSSTSIPASSMSTPPSSSLPPLPLRPKHPNKPKRILLLGSGMVAGPAIRWISERIVKGKDVELVVAGKEQGELEKLEGVTKIAGNFDSGMVTFRQLDVGNPAKDGEVSKLVGDVDVVISLLPAPLHPSLAKICIVQQTHLITASYILPEMRSLDRAAQKANVLLLNEIGLDPGIDHVSAISMLERLKEEGKEVLSFVSFCGGLPEPRLLRSSEHTHIKIGKGKNLGYPPAGPLSYKFSWSPRGVLTAALNGARYKTRGSIVEVPGVGFPGEGSGILSQENMFPEIDFGKCEHDEELRKLQGLLEGLPNRDSLPYAEMYGLPEGTKTVLRGTLRYKGFSTLMSHFHQQGFLDMDRTIDCKSLLTSESREVIDQIRARPSLSSTSYLTSSSAKTESKDEKDPLAHPLAWLLSADTGTPPVTNMTQKWIGLPILPSFPTTPLDLFTLILSHKLQYSDGERDMVVLVHEVVTRDAVDECWSGEIEEEIHTSSLVIYGSYSHIPNHSETLISENPEERYYESAMARSVGIPVAVAALAVLDGAVDPVNIGVHGPGHFSIRGHVLDGMRKAGIGMKEGMKRGNGNGPKKG
ncbi:Saccharopine dehydrogenase-domain-containing protein [Lentinula aciculospora]|uniref:Saccharopine dehydrogenase-domain-containing protein n=1 Tax=Lentinula aciculospora TaxID=153920 RepID=A0A9W9A750_9AGAR|nr:Saccharopine dehydrogenase-domain-containing protein [Lentinula aciculospora]